ncbi:hypothetical protein Tco_0023790, partial [Tanacetum coccineum]
AKDIVIVKLKEQIKFLKGNVEDSSVKMGMDEIDTLNIELEHRVTKLVTENEHLKQTYKLLYDSIKPKRVIEATINVISRNEATQLYGAILPVALTNEDIRNSESYKEYYAMASGTIPPKTKGSKKEANTETISKLKPPTAPRKRSREKEKQKTAELETISEANLTEAEQLKIITKRSRQETHSSHASGSGADEGTGVTPGVPDAPDYDSEDDISWKSSDDAQDDEDEDKNDVNETIQDDEDDDVHDDDENA